MIHRLATEAGDLFSAFVSVAGTMPATLWNARPEKADISFFQITGEKDDVVPKQSNGSAQYSIFPAIEDVMAYWAEACSLEAMETEEIASSLLTKHYSAETPQQVWHLLVQNGRHSWPTERFTGIDANAQILLFFEALNTGS